MLNETELTTSLECKGRLVLRKGTGKENPGIAGITISENSGSGLGRVKWVASKELGKR